MRTTVEIKDEYRARLQEIAARRGLKGFSTLVEEAIELYLQGLPAQEDKLKKTLALRGSLSTAEADRLLESTRLLRRGWR
jgi:predicted transcriptional regulator